MKYFNVALLVVLAQVATLLLDRAHAKALPEPSPTLFGGNKNPEPKTDVHVINKKVVLPSNPTVIVKEPIPEFYDHKHKKYGYKCKNCKPKENGDVTVSMEVQGNPVPGAPYYPQPVGPRPYDPRPYDPRPYDPRPYDPRPYDPHPYNPIAYSPYSVYSPSVGYPPFGSSPPFGASPLFGGISPYGAYPQFGQFPPFGGFSPFNPGNFGSGNANNFGNGNVNGNGANQGEQNRNTNTDFTPNSSDDGPKLVDLSRLNILGLMGTQTGSNRDNNSPGTTNSGTSNGSNNAGNGNTGK